MAIVNNETKNDNPSTGVRIKQIVRVKNSFKNFLKWKSMDEYGYCDVKLNVIISNGKVAMIAEIQVTVSVLCCFIWMQYDSDFVLCCFV